MTSTTTLARWTVRRLASGRLVDVDPDGHVHFESEQVEEGPSCNICDALGHGYPGGGPCPLEETGWADPDSDRDLYEPF
jgi:hypothetical protein